MLVGDFPVISQRANAVSLEGPVQCSLALDLHTFEGSLAGAEHGGNLPKMFDLWNV